MVLIAHRRRLTCLVLSDRRPSADAQAHALRMAAEGAVAAYEKVVGETWKPFERPVDNTTDTVGRKAAKAQMSAFD